MHKCHNHKCNSIIPRLQYIFHKQRFCQSCMQKREIAAIRIQRLHARISILNRLDDHLQDHPEYHEKYNECSICASFILPGAKIIQLKCGHKFHLHCANKLTSSSNFNFKCPNCRGKWETVVLQPKPQPNQFRIVEGCRLQPNTNFAGKYLSGEDLSNVDLTGSNFSATNLTGANLSNSTLIKTTFNFATKLENANFYGSDLSAASFIRVRSMEGTILTKIIISDKTIFEQINMAKSIMDVKTLYAFQDMRDKLKEQGKICPVHLDKVVLDTTQSGADQNDYFNY